MGEKRRRHRPPQVIAQKFAMARGRIPDEAPLVRIWRPEINA
jgi:hypothetical protein